MTELDEQILAELNRLRFSMQQAYSAAQACDADRDHEGSTMWFSIAWDREEAFDQYVQQLDAWFVAAEKLGLRL
jgi:hypothetical protein